jgi:adenylate cyclase
MKELLLSYLQNLRSRINHNWVGGGIGAGVAFVLAFALLDYRINDTPVGQPLMDLSYDLPFSLRQDIVPEEVVIVYIDEISTSHLKEELNGAWDRMRHAELLQYLKKDGAQAVVFDVIFGGESSKPQSDEQMALRIKEMGKVILGARINVVEVQGAPSHELEMPAETFLKAGARAGLVTQLLTRDRTIREHFHGFPRGDQAKDLASLSWTAAEDVRAAVVKESSRFENRWINYYGPPGTIPFRSYYQVLQTNIVAGITTIQPGYFKDKIVFVGSRQTLGFVGTGLDEFRSPFELRSGLRNLSHPGVEVHATVFLNLLRKDWLRRVHPIGELAIFTATGLLFGFGLVLARPLSATILALVGITGIIIAAALSFRAYIWFAWLIAVCQIGLAWLWSVVFNSVRLFVQKRLMEQSLSMYVSPSRVKQIARRPDILKPGAEKQIVTVLFSDIANFTSISEGMDSDVLAKLMNNYFEAAVTHCIQKADGTVVKFIGDAIFAMWNAPETQADHQARGCHGALLLRDKVTEFMKEQAEGLKLITRIGLHTGVANVGNFGSSRRIDYTAIGENINLASRMEGLNKYVGTTVLLTRDTRDGVGDQYVTRLVGHFILKGFEKVVEVYELVGDKDSAEPTRAWRDTFSQALEQFQKRNFGVAESGFRRTLEIKAEDGPSKFYLKHIAELGPEPPAEDWTGAIELKEK